MGKATEKMGQAADKIGLNKENLTNIKDKAANKINETAEKVGINPPFKQDHKGEQTINNMDHQSKSSCGTKSEKPDSSNPSNSNQKNDKWEDKGNRKL